MPTKVWLGFFKTRRRRYGMVEELEDEAAAADTELEDGGWRLGGGVVGELVDGGELLISRGRWRGVVDFKW